MNPLEPSRRTLRINLIGAGNVARHLSRALQRAGHTVAGVCSHTGASAQRLAGELGCTAFGSPAELPEADLCFIAVADRAIPQVVSQLPDQPQCIFAHTAGSVSIGVFGGQVRRYGVFYPLQTFSREREVDFSRVPIFVEGCDAQTEAALHQLGSQLSASVNLMDSDHRRYLHLASVFACNFSNHCYALAEQLLRRSGTGFESLLPIIDETAQKVHALRPAEAQTGPAVRRDTNVTEAQARLLEGTPLADVYRAMTRSIQALEP